MSGEMIKRVAKAMGCIDADRCPKIDKDAGTCTDCVDAARRVIKAMQKPTQRMIEAGDDVIHYDGLEEAPGNAPAGDTWRAMIDAALEPNK